MKLSINTSSKYDIIIKPNLINAIDGCLDEFNSGQLFVLCYSKPLSVSGLDTSLRRISGGTVQISAPTFAASTI